MILSPTQARPLSPDLEPDVTIQPDLTVNKLLLARPDFLPILSAAGIDTCCGGAETLERAAACAGLDWDELLTRLEAGTHAADPLPPVHGCGCGCGARHS